MSRKAKPTAEKATPPVHSFHVPLPSDLLRRLRILAAERGTSAGRLARELLAKAMEEESRRQEK